MRWSKGNVGSRRKLQNKIKAIFLIKEDYKLHPQNGNISIYMCVCVFVCV